VCFLLRGFLINAFWGEFTVLKPQFSGVMRGYLNDIRHLLVEPGPFAVGRG
jgi:hypothetical protein